VATPTINSFSFAFFSVFICVHPRLNDESGRCGAILNAAKGSGGNFSAAAVSAKENECLHLLF
jgi:hypothetical protein